MRSVCSARTAVTLAVSVLVLTANLPPLRAAEEQDHERVEITGTHDRQQFAAGARVRIHDATLTDAFAAGGNVGFERVTAEDIYAAGGSLRYRDTVVEDLVTAAGDLLVEAEIKDDLIAAGGRIRLDADASVGGDVVVAGGELELAGRIHGNVKGAGGHVVLSGVVGGDVDLAVSELVVDPSARISGRLVYRSEEAAQISPQAIIEGGVERIEISTPHFSIWAGVGIGIAVILAAVVGMILLSSALQGAMPRAFHAALGRLATQPWMSWLLGFGALIAVPVAANILLISLVGLPFGLFLYAAYGVGLALGLVTTAYWLGSLVATRTRAVTARPSTRSQILRSALGMLLLLVLGLIPLLGWLVLLAVVPAGVGAFIAESSRRIRQLNSATSVTEAPSTEAATTHGA